MRLRRWSSALPSCGHQASPNSADATVDGSPVEVESGVIMRTAITANGFELYRGLMAKAQQCGGGGQCNLCWVDVVDGADKLSPKTDAERKRGKKKPELPDGMPSSDQRPCECSDSGQVACIGWRPSACNPTLLESPQCSRMNVEASVLYFAGHCHVLRPAVTCS